MAEFKKSQEQAFRRTIRDLIRGGPFSKGERDVILAFFNHWFAHRNNEKGFVHPGRKKLAKRAGVTVRTVASTLALLREHHAIQAVGHLNGLQGMATEYTVSIEALRLLCRKSKADLRKSVCKISRPAQAPAGVQKFHTVNSNVLTFPYQRKA